MKREIRFKALRADGKGWVYGMPTFDLKYMFNGEQMDSPNNYEIDPETVCQFTGLQDKNGVDIYEWDVVMAFNSTYDDEPMENTVGVINGCIRLISKVDNISNIPLYNYRPKNLEVIGNIHQTDKP